MIARSRDLWLVAFFLSKFSSNKKPPIETGTVQWNKAYKMFYEALGQGRTILSFEHSLKNARDSFDSHIYNSDRVGWKDKVGKPKQLENIAKEIFTKYSNKNRNEIWNEIKHFFDKDIKALGNIIDDLISIQESEESSHSVTKTEGGIKVVFSNKYERNITLRDLAFKIHGYNCMVCDFNFYNVYGKWGERFGEVHHVVPLANSKGRDRKTDPKTDLIILCANCHRMVHRRKGITLTIKELQSKINTTILNPSIKIKN
jgi:5-methylcytosine-specific restriction protein A